MTLFMFFLNSIYRETKEQKSGKPGMNIFIKNDTFYVFLNSIYRETKEQKSGKPGTLFLI